MVNRAVQGDCKRECFLGVHFLSLALKESILIVIGNGIVGSERSVESPDCLLLHVILKLLLPSKMCFGGKKKLFASGCWLEFSGSVHQPTLLFLSIALLLWLVKRNAWDELGKKPCKESQNCLRQSVPHQGPMPGAHSCPHVQ